MNSGIHRTDVIGTMTGALRVSAAALLRLIAPLMAALVLASATTGAPAARAPAFAARAPSGQSDTSSSGRPPSVAHDDATAAALASASSARLVASRLSMSPGGARPPHVSGSIADVFADAHGGLAAAVLDARARLRSTARKDARTAALTSSRSSQGPPALVA